MGIHETLQFTGGNVKAAAAIVARAGKRTFSQREEDDTEPQPKPKKAFLELPNLTGVYELDMRILLELDDYSLAQACQTSRSIREICHDRRFWELKLQRFDPDVRLKKEWGAAELKHFYLVVSIADASAGGWMNDAINQDAAMSLDIVKYLIGNGYSLAPYDMTEIWTEDAIEIIEYLWDDYLASNFTVDDLKQIVRSNSLLVLDFVNEHVNDTGLAGRPLGKQLENFASGIAHVILNGHVTMLRKIDQLGYDLWHQYHVDIAALSLDPETFEFVFHKARHGLLFYDDNDSRALLAGLMRDGSSSAYLDFYQDVKGIKDPVDPYAGRPKVVMKYFAGSNMLAKAMFNNKKDVFEKLITEDQGLFIPRKHMEWILLHANLSGKDLKWYFEFYNDHRDSKTRIKLHPEEWMLEYAKYNISILLYFYDEDVYDPEQKWALRAAKVVQVAGNISGYNWIP